VFSEYHTTLYEQNLEITNVKAGGIYSYHCALRGRNFKRYAGNFSPTHDCYCLDIFLHLLSVKEACHATKNRQSKLFIALQQQKLCICGTMKLHGEEKVIQIKINIKARENA
jgi:hypothetical protein